MEKIQLYVDYKTYKDKEKAKAEASSINNRITKNVTEVTPEELARLVGAEGRTMVPSLMKGKRGKANFLETRILALDFDNKVDGKRTKGKLYQTIEEALKDDFIQEHASFIYTTLSHMDSWEKFRVVFVLDKPLVTDEEVMNAYKYLSNKFGNADTGAMESARMFFGGFSEPIEVNYSNILSTSSFPDVAPQMVKPAKSRKVREVKTVQTVLDFEIEEPTWKLIKAGEKDLVKDRWQQYGADKSFKDDSDAFDFFRSLDMKELLGVKSNPFHDILAYDENPSASIWKPDDTNTYLYTTLNNQGENGRNRSYDIIQIVQKLLGCSYLYAQQYLAETTGINFNISNELVEVYRQADNFKRILVSESFKEQHPEMYQIFGRYKYSVYINAIIDIFKGQLYEYDGEIRCLNWGNPKNIAKRLNIHEKKAQRLLNLMSLTKITAKLDDSQVPEQLLELLENNRTHVKTNSGEWVKRKTAREYRSNVYELGELTKDFTGIEERCVELTEKDFTMQGLSREYVIRTFGVEEADRIYPQDKDRKISKKSSEMTALIHKVALEEIKENKFVIISELKDTIQRKYKSKGLTDYKYKQAEAEMLEAYGLKKIGLTNQLKEQYHITHLKPTARPNILIFV